MALAEITEADLDLERHLAAVSAPEFGAVATFIGQIRDHDPGAPDEVERLEYTAHPDAQSVLDRIVAGLERPEVRIAVSHRVGMLEVGDRALIACVASAHRQAAFDLNRELVEKVKAELPIWKRQIQVDGRHNWQGLR